MEWFTLVNMPTFDLLENDDFETLKQLVEDEKAQSYISDNFGSFNGSKFIDDLHLICNY
ncbi:MAG: hypothetical protein IPF54_26375 [Draconibacterium sp.]|nr:hypothetical protein [Draconibacterium sp.]